MRKIKSFLIIAVLLVIVTSLNAQEEGVVINGIRWATRNVDAPNTFTINPEDAGMFYQWNRKIGWSSTNPMINSDGGTTWDVSMPEGDSWGKTNDPCPTGWRIPTLEELQSLVAAGSQWTTKNGVYGRYFGSGEQTVFFPAAGSRYFYGGTLLSVGVDGMYWSETPYPSLSWRAYHMYLHSSGVYMYYYERNNGHSVRCVADGNVGVNEVSSDTEDITVIGYFDILGKRLNEEPNQGIYIILYNNGKTKKVMIFKD